MRTLGYRPALDGVRGVAVLLVVGFHAWGWPKGGGELGVEIFFVLSGFLITSLLLEEHAATGEIGFRRFYIRRALRLLPVLYATLAVTTVVVLALHGSDRTWYLESIAAAALYVGNLYGLFASHTDLAPAVGHLWSLAVEEQFYLVWPIVLVALLRVTGSKPRSLMAILAIGIVASIALRALLSTATTAGWTLPTTYTDALLVGALLAVAHQIRDLPAARLLAVGLLAAACFLPTIDRTVGHGLLFEWLVLVGVVLVGNALRGPTWLQWRPLVFLGSISYGLYVFHVLVLHAAAGLLPDMNDDVRALGAVIVSIAAAYVSRRWFEAWFLRRKPEPPTRTHLRDLPGQNPRAAALEA